MVNENYLKAYQEHNNDVCNGKKVYYTPDDIYDINMGYLGYYFIKEYEKNRNRFQFRVEDTMTLLKNKIGKEYAAKCEEEVNKWIEEFEDEEI